MSREPTVTVSTVIFCSSSMVNMERKSMSKA